MAWTNVPGSDAMEWQPDAASYGGLLGGLSGQDKTLALGLLGLGMLGGNYGRNKREAMANAFQGGMQGGLTGLNMTTQAAAQQRRLGQADQEMALRQAHLGLAQNQDARAQEAFRAQEAERQRVQGLIDQMRGLPTTKAQAVPQMDAADNVQAMSQQQVPLTANERVTQMLPFISQISPTAGFSALTQQAGAENAAHERTVARNDAQEFQRQQMLAQQQFQDAQHRQAAAEREANIRLQRELANASRQPQAPQIIQSADGIFALGPNGLVPLTGPDGKPLRPTAGNKPGENYLKQQTGIANVQNAIQSYSDVLKGFGMTDYFSPSAMAKLTTAYNNLMLQAKEAYNLGVLNGPDYEIMQKVITNPQSFRGAITPQGGLQEQLTQLGKLMEGIKKTSAEVHGQPVPVTSSPASGGQTASGRIRYDKDGNRL